MTKRTTRSVVAVDKKMVIGVAIGITMAIMLCGVMLDTEWQTNDEMSEIPYTPDEGTNFEDTLNYAIFETYGPLLLVVGMLLFGAIIGGAAVSQEEEDEHDD